MKKNIFIIILSTILLTSCGNNNDNATSELQTETVTETTTVATTEDTTSVSNTTMIETTITENTTTPETITEVTTTTDTTTDTTTETTENTSESSITETSIVAEETSIEDLPLDNYENYIKDVLEKNKSNEDFNKLSLIQATQRDFLKTAILNGNRDKISNMYQEYMKTITEKNYLESANLEKDLDDNLQMVETANKDSLKIIIEGSIGQGIKEDIKSISVEALNTLPEDKRTLSENDIRVMIDEAYAKVCSGYANNNQIEIVSKYGITKEDLSK